MVDYRFHNERFYINNIPSQGINITLFGRIDDISENVSIFLFLIMIFLESLLIKILLHIKVST